MSDLTGIDTTHTSTTAEYDVADIVRFKHATYGRGAWVYGQADEAITAGQAVFVTESDGGLTLADTTESGSTAKLVGIADTAIASGSYGWVWVGEGTFEAIVTNAVAAGTNLTTTGTGGTVGTGGDAINGLISVDAGVTSTRVTVEADGILSVN